MKRQCYNPYLPSWEYIPDAEPKVFGQRLYIYGSHDLFGAKEYCEGDYVCWSTPVDDLSDWRYEGVIFKSKIRRGIKRTCPTMHRMWCAAQTDGTTFTIRWPIRRSHRSLCVTSLRENTNIWAMFTSRTGESTAQSRRIGLCLTQPFWWMMTGGCFSTWAAGRNQWRIRPRDQGSVCDGTQL